MEIIAFVLLAAVVLNVGLIIASKIYIKSHEEPAPSRTDEKVLK